jgi:hypothetical protein
MLATVAALILTTSAVAPATSAVGAAMAEPNPKTMSQKEIRAHNAKLDARHPYYIRCVKSAPTGSLIAREVSCRTNQQWAAADNVGNDEARVIQDKMASKFWKFEG